MKVYSVRRWSVIAGLAFIIMCLPVQAQQKEDYEPTVGQAGKDVVWVPTQQDLVEKMLDLAKVTPQDFVVDLGSGDGRTVITAARRGARALGIEYNPDMVELSRRNAVQAGVSGKAEFIKADLFESDFSKATVLTLFLLPDLNIKLRPKILAMKPGTRVVSNSFSMDDWEADDSVSVEDHCVSWCTAYLWIVPAKVEGQWKLPDGELDIRQQFQKISGSYVSGGKTVPISGKMIGSTIHFTAGQAEYTGDVQGDEIRLRSGEKVRIAMHMAQ